MPRTKSKVCTVSGVKTSERNFYKTFALAEHVEVKGAEIVDGILSIELMRNIPEEKKPKTIKIK